MQSLKHFKTKNIILSDSQILQEVKETAQEIDHGYGLLGVDEIVLLTVLNGAMYFAADLSRHLNIGHHIECIRVSSYGNGSKSSGNVKILDSIRLDLQNKHVLIVDEILDTGNTLHALEGMIKGMGAASVNVCVLLERDIPRQFTIPIANTPVKVKGDEFLVGYGLDYEGLYRNLKDVVSVEFK